MLRKLLDVNEGKLPDNCQVVFSNTGIENKATLDFVQECSERWSVKITWVEMALDSNRKYIFRTVNHNSASRNGEPYIALVEKAKYLPNIMHRFCTSQLKVLPSANYLKSLGWTTWSNSLGIRVDERHRVSNSQGDWFNWYPLVGSNITKQDVLEFWASNSFDLNLEVHNGKSLFGNCEGCFLKSEAELAELYRRHPDRYQWWIDMEKRVSDITNRKDKKVETVSRFRKDMSYKELADFVDKQGDWIFDNEEFLCQASSGECTG